VVAAAFWVITITSGSFYSYGVFFKPMLAEFGWNRQLTAGVMGVACLIYVMVLPFVGHFADRRGPRLVMAVSTGLLGAGYLLGAYVQSAFQLYLFVGVLGGLSYPGLLPIPIAVVSRWFDGNRGLALGITLAGVGAGTLAMPPLIALLVEGYGWRDAFFVLGLLVCLTCIPPCVLFMRDPEGKGGTSSGEGDSGEFGAAPAGTMGPELSLQQALGTRAFWLLFFLYGFCIIVLGMIMIHIVPHLTDSGMSARAAANVLGAIGLGSVLGRILVGVLADRYGTKLVLVACLIIKGIVLLCLPEAGGFLFSYALGFFYGVSYGGFMVVIPALTSYLFGLSAMGAIFATISIAEGVGFGLGSYLAGYIWDMSGSYRMMFLIGIALVLASILLAAFLKAPAPERS
jgi:MFS family permease